MKNSTIPTATYILKPGDTIKSISDFFQISPKALIELNGNVPLIMTANRSIKVPLHPNSNFHVIRPGETIQDLLIRFKLMPDQLIALNDDLLLSPGQVIQVQG